MGTISCPSAFEFSCPEIVPVTVHQTIVQIEDSPAMYRTQRFKHSSVQVDGKVTADNKTLSLDYFPYEPASVLLVRNTGVQRFGVDFDVQGQYVVLTTPIIDADEEIFVTYLSVAGTVASQGGAVGSIVSAAGTTLTGYLRFENSTSHVWNTYSALRNWFWGDGVSPVNKASDAGTGIYRTRRDTLLTTYSTTNFTLVSLQDVSYDGANLVTLNKFIKT